MKNRRGCSSSLWFVKTRREDVMFMQRIDHRVDLVTAQEEVARRGDLPRTRLLKLIVSPSPIAGGIAFAFMILRGSLALPVVTVSTRGIP